MSHPQTDLKSSTQRWETRLGELGNRLKRFRRTFSLLVVTVGFLALFIPTPKHDPAQPFPAGQEDSFPPELCIERKEYLLKQDPFNPSIHWEFIAAHFPGMDAVNLAELIEKYGRLAGNSDSAIADLGNLGRGLIAIFRDDCDRGFTSKYEEALFYLGRIKNPDLRFANLLKGRALTELNRFSEARPFLDREIVLNNATASTKAFMVRFNARSEEFEKAASLLEESWIEQRAVPSSVFQTYFQTGKWEKYSAYLWYHLANRWTMGGFIGASISFLFWFLFLRRIDVTGLGSDFPLISTCGLGMLTVPLLYFVDDAFRMYISVETPSGANFIGSWPKYFADLVLNVGLLEEGLKLLPLLFIFIFTRRLKEPGDFLIYASMSGLGFAFEENLSYFSDPFSASFFGRGFFCSSVHMAFCSITGYGLIPKGPGWMRPLRLGLFFCLAVLAHGFYDFSVLWGPVPALLCLTGIFLVWRWLLMQSLVRSSMFDWRRIKIFRNVEEFLFQGLCVVLLANFVLKSWYVGPEAPLFESLFFGPLGLLLPVAMGHLFGEGSPPPSLGIAPSNLAGRKPSTFIGLLVLYPKRKGFRFLLLAVNLVAAFMVLFLFLYLVKDYSGKTPVILLFMIGGFYATLFSGNLQEFEDLFPYMWKQGSPPSGYFTPAQLAKGMGPGLRPGMLKRMETRTEINAIDKIRRETYRPLLNMGLTILILFLLTRPAVLQIPRIQSVSATGFIVVLLAAIPFSLYIGIRLSGTMPVSYLIAIFFNLVLFLISFEAVLLAGSFTFALAYVSLVALIMGGRSIRG